MPSLGVEELIGLSGWVGPANSLTLFASSGQADTAPT